MILNERESRHEHVLHVARQMMTAARTAPKGKGVDIIEIAMVTDGDINILSEMMVKMVAEHGMKFFLRDAENILNAECVLFVKKECPVLSIVSMWALPSDQLVPRQQTTGWTHGSCSRPD